MDVTCYVHIVETFFEDGIVNKGRVIVLFCLAKIVSKKYPQQKEIIWNTFAKAIEGKGYELFLEKGRLEKQR